MLKLRKTEPGEPLVVAMTAVRTGDRLLIVGCGDLKVITQIAAKPGISGRACAVDTTPERTARAAEAAEREGALLDVETSPLASLPFANESFDVVVVNHLLGDLHPNERVSSLIEAARVLRGGGRCIVIEPGRRGGLSALFAAAPSIAPPEMETLMNSAGFRAVRTIAERAGLVFVEGGRRT